MKFVNLNKHEISFFHKGEVVTLPGEPNAATVTTKETHVCEIDGIPVVLTVRGNVGNVPEPKEGVVYIVNLMVRSALSGRPDVVALDSGPSAVRWSKEQAQRGICTVAQVNQIRWVTQFTYGEASVADPRAFSAVSAT